MNSPVPTGGVPRTDHTYPGSWSIDSHEALTFHPLPTAETKASNPKEAIGSTKLDFSVVPSSAPAYLATAFTEGALKYGSYNWRVAGVRASTYKAACDRHVAKWWNGENTDPVTKVKHLANAMACLAIILDAELVNLLNDDRPPKADLAKLLEELGGTVAHLKDISKGYAPIHNTALNQPKVTEI